MVESRLMMSFYSNLSVFIFWLAVIFSSNLQPDNLAILQSSQDVSGVKVELQPPDMESPSTTKPPRFKRNVRLKIVVTNNSNELIRALILDTYYQNRPKLYKNDQLVPYRKEITTLVTSKDNDPHFIRLGHFVTLHPTMTKKLGELNLADWYNALEPGLYRISNRYRFEIYGEWSSESEAMEFEVVAEQE